MKIIALLQVQKKIYRRKESRVYACADVNKRTHARTHATYTCDWTEKASSREKHAPCMPRWNSARERNTLVLQKSWPRIKVTICRSIDQSNRSNGGPSASGPLPLLDFNTPDWQRWTLVSVYADPAPTHRSLSLWTSAKHHNHMPPSRKSQRTVGNIISQYKKAYIPF